MTENNLPSFNADNLLFPHLFRSFRISIQPTKILLAFTAIALLFLIGWLMDFAKPVIATADVTKQRIATARIEPYDCPTELHYYLARPLQTKLFTERYDKLGTRIGLGYTLYHFLAGRFNESIFSILQLNIPNVISNIILSLRALYWAVRFHPLYSLPYFALTLVIMSFTGAAICRIAALQFARDEKPGLIEAFRFGFSNFTSFLIAPLAPICIVLFLGLFIFLMGLIGNVIWVGEIFIAVFLILALIIGVLITLVIIGTFAGAGLMYPTIAFEGSDGFDALSRSFCYVYSRPWRMTGYSFISAVYGAACYVFVRFFIFIALLSTYWFLKTGSLAKSRSVEGLNKLSAIWPKPEFLNFFGPNHIFSLESTEYVSAFIISLAILAFAGILIAFVISFYFSANSIIYALLRKKADNVELSNIYTKFEQQQAASVIFNVNITKRSQ